MTRSTVAPISKVGSQGHSPLPYQAGRHDRKWRSCRIRARARIERESPVRVLASHPPVVLRLPHSRSLTLARLPGRGPCHTRAMPPRSAPRSTTHWQRSLRDTCYFLLDFSPSPAAGRSSPLPPPLLASTSSSSSSRHRRRSDASWCTSRRASHRSEHVSAWHWITSLISSGDEKLTLGVSHDVSPRSRLAHDSPARPITSRIVTWRARGSCRVPMTAGGVSRGGDARW